MPILAVKAFLWEWEGEAPPAEIEPDHAGSVRFPPRIPLRRKGTARLRLWLDVDAFGVGQLVSLAPPIVLAATAAGEAKGAAAVPLALDVPAERGAPRLTSSVAGVPIVESNPDEEEEVSLLALLASALN